MADQDGKADFKITPEVLALRYLYKEPAKKKGIKRDQQERMSKVPMIFEIKLTVDEAQNKIRVREKSHREPCNRSPFSNFLITNGFCNDSAGQRMSDRVHLNRNINL